MLTRTVSTGKRSYSSGPKSGQKRQNFGSGPLSQPLSLRRYLGSRGTPQGVYEITRNINTDIPIASGLFAQGAISGTGMAIVFGTQTTQTLINNTLVNTANMPNAAELAAVWDDCKLDKVEVTLGFGGGASTNSTNQTPTMFLVGTDDNSAESTETIVQQLGDCKSWYASSANNSVFRITVKPKFQQLIYYTALTSGYQAKRGYNRSDYDIPHYALKIAIPQLTNGTAAALSGRLTISMKYFFKYKSLK